VHPVCITKCCIKTELVKYSKTQRENQAYTLTDKMTTEKNYISADQTADLHTKATHENKEETEPQKTICHYE